MAVLVQTGAVGLLIAVVALVLWLIRSRESGGLDSANLRAGFAAMAVMAAFHDFLNVDVVIWWWALALGLLEAAAGKDAGRESDASRSGGPDSVGHGPFVRGPLGGGPTILGTVAVGQRGRGEDLVDRVQRAEPWFEQPWSGVFGQRLRCRTGTGRLPPKRWREAGRR